MTRRSAPRAVRLPAFAVVIPLLVAACWSTCACTQSLSPSTSPGSPTAAGASLTPVPGGSAAATPGPAVSPATQTDTEWGRIWDALPPSFPLPPDAVATETGEEGPVSGSFAIGAAAPNAAAVIQTAMTGAGFSFESVEGPLEDGSMTLNAVGRDPDCRAQIRVRPLSGTTNVVVLYGAGCPFE